jgi:uncharacterized spore protein YtfJ
MEDVNFLETVSKQFGQNASVKNVYGEPILAQGKTIIPVAKIAMGLGGGQGQSNGKYKKQQDNPPQPADNKGGFGGGAGGGMIATAKGVYEVTGKCTRYIPANATKQLLVAAGIAFIVGRWVGTKRRNKTFNHPSYKA